MSIDQTRQTVPEFLIRSAELWPDQDWVRTPGGAGSRATVLDRARHVAGGLRAAGVRPGDRGVLAAPNSVDFLVAWFAAMFVRSPVLPVTRCAPATERAAVASGLEPRLIMAPDAEVATLTAALASGSG